MTTHPFRDLTTVTPSGTGADGRYSAHIDSIWTIGPKVHGGCMMAVCAAAARRELTATAPSDMPVDPAVQSLAVSANYLAAPDPGDVDIVATVRKRGRQVSLVDVELSQNGRPAVHAAVTWASPTRGAALRAGAGARATARRAARRGARARRRPSDGADRARLAGLRSAGRRRVGALPQRQAGRTRGPDVGAAVGRRRAGPATAALFAIMTGDICAPVTMNRGIFGWAPTVQLTTYLRRRPAPGWLRVMASSTVFGGHVVRGGPHGARLHRCSRRAEPSARDDPAVGAFGACAPFR
ncbi:thioesterase family protein [Rhodococcus hoagii]|nr:thioesterase family protein [Prescottella equi]